MISLLRKARRQFFGEGRFTQYLGYAAGEIVLIVAGILIALQISNWNSARQDRAKEMSYLTNIRADLAGSIREIDRQLAERNERIAGAKRILAHFNGQPITDASAFNADSVNIYSWERFYLGDNTYRELVSSGNFALLSNPAIKRQLLNVEALYGKMKSEEDHYRFDTETALYKPLYDIADTEAMIADLEYRTSGGKSGRAGAVTPETFRPVLGNMTMKNGFVLTILEYQTMNGQMTELRDRCMRLIRDIDADIRRG